MRACAWPLLELVIACALASGCGSEGRTGQGASPGRAAAAGEGGAVVATVDGVPLTAERVAGVGQAAGMTAQETVERLIDFELLAAEAERRGLGGASEVTDPVRKALVQRFLEGFEATHRPEDVPEAVLKEAYESHRGSYRRPRMYKVAQILVNRVAKASPAKVAEERALAEEIHREAVKATSLEAFLAAGLRFNGSNGFKVDASGLETPVHEYASLVKEFIDAALALKKVGDISPPVQTKYGSHIIYLTEVKAAIDQSFEEVRDDVRTKAYPYWVQGEFNALVEELRVKGGVRGYEGEKRRRDPP